MQKTWKPQVAGILSIISGVIGLIVSFGILIAIVVIGSTGQWATDWDNYWNEYWQVSNVIPILWAIGIPIFLCAVVSIIGGIFAIQRKLWGLALTGAILAFFPVWIFGLLAVIFLALSHDEFKQVPNQTVTAVKTN